MACEAGLGLTGDRYQREEIGHKRQVTFFDLDVHRDLLRRFPGSEVETDVYRRNVVIDGVDLNGLIGKQFWLRRGLFEGVEECRPCYWMDTAFGPGTEEALKGRGWGVLVREEFRPTEADLWIRPPGQLLDFLLSCIF